MSVKNPNEFDLVIDPKNVQKEYLKDLFRFRELIYFFAMRDILVRYKQTFLGILWALIRPLLNMAVFVLVFGKIAHLPSDGVNYPLFVLVGMVPWQLFSSCLVDSSASLVLNAPLISKVYFPRMIMPINSMIVALTDFSISLGLLMILFLFQSALNQWTFFLLPLMLLLALVLCLGTSLWISALTVRFRDLRFIVPFIVQFGVFISPVGYGSFLISEKWLWIYFLNPVAGIIEGFRWCCFGVYHSYLPLGLLLSFSISFLLLVTGFVYFRKMERIFADII